MTTSAQKKLRVFVPFALGYFLSYLFRVVNAVLAPDLASELGAGPSQLGLLTAAYFFTFAAFQLPLGVLLDRFGPRKIEQTSISIKDQLRGITNVFSSLMFWRIAPLTVTSQAAFLAIQGLWSGPWLRDVAGFERTDVAQVLLTIAAAMVAGFILIGAAAERLSRLGIKPIAVAVAGMSAFMLVQTLLIFEVTSWARTLWVLYGIFGTTGIVPYAVLSQSFPLHLSGRVNTALNLLVFVAAFSAQWGIGAIINFWPVTAGGGYAPAGYQAAFTMMLLLQLISLLWFTIISLLHHRRRQIE